MNPEDLRMVDVLRERKLVPDSCLAIMLVGSSARGWSNARSDYDLYVVRDGRPPDSYRDVFRLPVEPAEIYSTAFYFDGRRWEVTTWLGGQVRQIIDKVAWSHFDNRIPGQILLGREEVMVERLSTCVPIYGEAWIRERQAEIKESAFQTMVITRSLATADDAVEDALGMLESRDFPSALLAARRALGHSVDAVLEQYGQFGSAADKWRPHRFRAAAPTILSFERYWELETMRSFDPAHPEGWVEEVLEVCRDIAMKVEI